MKSELDNMSKRLNPFKLHPGGIYKAVLKASDDPREAASAASRADMYRKREKTLNLKRKRGSVIAKGKIVVGGDGYVSGYMYHRKDGKVVVVAPYKRKR